MSPSRRRVVTVVRQEVVVQLPEDVECGPAVRCQDVMIGLPQLGIEVVQHQQLA